MKKSVLILGAGSGTRMNNKLPKQYILIKDKPIIFHTIEKFGHFDEIVVVINKNHISLPGFFKSNNYTTHSLGKVYHHAKDDIDSWDFYYDIPSEINNYYNWESFASQKNQEITNNDLRPAVENVSSPLRKYNDYNSSFSR